MEGGAVGHIFEREPPRDHPYQVWFNFQTYIYIFKKKIIRNKDNFNAVPSIVGDVMFSCCPSDCHKM
jgi:hypothetical protein